MKLRIRHDNSTVEFINLMSMDASNLENFTIMAHWLLIGPLKATFIVAILVNQVSYTMLSGLILFFLMVPLQIALSQVFGSLKYVFQTNASE
jgi:hypothetical protein